MPALEELWRRFAGYGIGAPLVEQRAVLGTLAQLDCGAARAALKGIVLSGGLPASLLSAALRAAADAGLALPAAFVGPLLDHGDIAVREPAFIRRSGALALGNLGDAGAREALIEELIRNPSGEVIEALAAIADDDVIVHLGRCAECHPAFVDIVLDILREMGSAKAARLARRLEASCRVSGKGGC